MQNLSKSIKNRQKTIGRDILAGWVGELKFLKPKFQTLNMCLFAEGQNKENVNGRRVSGKELIKLLLLLKKSKKMNPFAFTFTIYLVSKNILKMMFIISIEFVSKCT